MSDFVTQLRIEVKTYSLDDVSEYASSQSLSDIERFNPRLGGTQTFGVVCGGVPEYPQCNGGL